MKLSISNIAWDPPEDAALAALLCQRGIEAIDVAPGKYFRKPASVSDRAITQVKDWWSDRGIEIAGMQALLFGTSGLNMFGSSSTQNAMLRHLAAMCRIGACLGAPRLVFGSPKNRNCAGLDDRQTMEIAVEFFRQLGDVAESQGVVVCLEPNPPSYGANFMTTSAETARVVREVSHPAVRMQFDTGALTINGEDPSQVLRDCGELIGHVHLSEPDLLPLGNGGCDHVAMSRALREFLPHQVVSIEMRATENEPHESAIARALTIAARHYHDRAAGVPT